MLKLIPAPQRVHINIRQELPAYGWQSLLRITTKKMKNKEKIKFEMQKTTPTCNKRKALYWLTAGPSSLAITCDIDTSNENLTTYWPG